MLLEEITEILTILESESDCEGSGYQEGYDCGKYPRKWSLGLSLPKRMRSARRSAHEGSIVCFREINRHVYEKKRNKKSASDKCAQYFWVLYTKKANELSVVAKQDSFRRKTCEE